MKNSTNKLCTISNKIEAKQLSAHFFSIFINILSLEVDITRKKVGCINFSLPENKSLQRN